MDLKRVTMYNYLKDLKKSNLKLILNNLSMYNVSIDLFFKVFDQVEQTPESVYNFITDSKNSYELSLFGHKASGNNRFYGYNGKGNYQGGTSTLGASHSKFHG